ncbi:hypothetical protein [Nocardioides sambongensis]|uniref:hypothetical protein n=1 Tax=Nocardioides sambongensis TaxID=2589074 RepID=UPI00112BD312|nr:hypothetical protein [Nocardioides sambongensis]
MTPARARLVRRGVFALLVVVVVGCLGAAVGVVYAHTSEGGPVERVRALADPPPDPRLSREQALGTARDFVVAFNTYGPDQLTDDGTMPDYAALAEDMTARFGTVFDKNVGYAEQTVAQLQVRREAEVYAAGIASADEDSAEVLVAGVARFSYPNPKKDGAWIDFDPERFRYQVSLVRQHGEWLVDDLDDLDDDLPSFAQSGGGEEGLPGQLPSDGASPGGTGQGGQNGGASGGQDGGRDDGDGEGGR